ncbi:hypothetical protein QMA77_19540 [Pantoea ananatis]|uniref:hypothetical protein n=1 Tax=Pantoea ananas TaxID=553 RepID=UPI0024AD9A1D|nr:hypothetical protein [Pantoea ananatis]MDI6539119.1 hypothetical protein [Pantoea ananatis]
MKRCEIQMIGYAVVVVLILLIATSVYKWRHANGAIPDYISRASEDLNNFLAYTYGDGHCKAANTGLAEWTLNCRYGGNDFVYGVTAARNAPYMLTALNQSADRSAEEGLTHFLNIERLPSSRLSSDESDR